MILKNGQTQLKEQDSGSKRGYIMSLKDGINMKGSVKITVKNIFTNEEEVYSFHNLVVTNGLNQISSLMMGEVSDTFNYICVGSGSTAVLSSDTALEYQVSTRKVCVSRQRIGNSAIYSTFFGSSDNNGSWTECGLATGSSGNIGARALLTYPITKTTSKTATIEWQIQVL